MYFRRSINGCVGCLTSLLKAAYRESSSAVSRVSPAGALKSDEGLTVLGQFALRLLTFCKHQIVKVDAVVLK